MRVLHIDTEMTWRGGENQLRLLLEGLAQTDAECHVAVRPGSAAATRLKGLGRMLELPMRGGGDLRAGWKLARYCRAEKIQLIDAHTSNGHALGLLAKLFAPELRLVVHRRVDFAPKGDFLNRRKYLSPKVDRYVAISGAIRDVLVAYGVPDARISVVRSATKPDAFRGFSHDEEKAKLARTFSLDPGLVFLGNASALTAQKGYETLIAAAKLLKDQGTPFHCFIAGDGELAGKLEKLRADLGLEHDVTFLGFIDEVPRFLTALDILAIPSNFEGLGTVILDAIHAGLAVAGSRVGGIPEIIKHGETGLLSEVGDAAGHAANLATLILDREKRAALNAAARAHVQREFSVGAMVGGNLDVYKELLR